MATTNPESIYFKTAELVRDEMGCYYFVCLQCGKYFENLDDIVEHIEKYFNDSPDDIGNEKNLLTPMELDEQQQQIAYIQQQQQQQCMSNDEECESDVFDLKIKDEPLDEYEDYKLTSQQICEVKNQTLTKCLIFCPICKKSFNSKENSLMKHLIRTHHRDKRYANIYECKVCGRNTFTRPYDLKRHELIHIREAESSELNLAEAEPITDALRNKELRSMYNEHFKEDSSITKLDVEQETLLINPLHQHQHESHDDVHFEHPKVKEELLIEYEGDASSRQPTHQVKNDTSIKCPICNKTVKSKENSLKSHHHPLHHHLIRMHHRNELHARIFECTFCGKNTFTRSYDLKRHEKIHIRKGEVPNSNITETPKLNKPQHQPQRKKSTKTKTINNLQSTEPEDSSQNHRTVKPTNSVTSNDFLTTDPRKTGISCVFCSKTFGSYLDVTNHLKAVHNQTKVYKCGEPNCGIDSFISAFELHRHEMSHSRNFVVDQKKRMNCIFCSRSFDKKWNLMKHEKRHLLREYEESASTKATAF